MPAALDQYIRAVSQYVHLIWINPLTKRFVTLIVIAISIYYAYTRIQRARHRQHLQQLVTAAETAIATANPVVHNRVPRAAPVYHDNNGAVDDRQPLTPAQKYLSVRHTKRSVCLTTRWIICDEDVRVFKHVIPIVLTLAHHTTLYTLTLIQANTDDAVQRAKERTIEALRECGAIEAGLKEHRILFCTTVKGKSSIIRHIEPTLYADHDLSVIQSIRPFVPDCVHIDPSLPVPTEYTPALLPPLAASTSTSAGANIRQLSTPSLPTLRMFFFGNEKEPGVSNASTPRHLNSQSQQHAQSSSEGNSDATTIAAATITSPSSSSLSAIPITTLST